MRSGGDQAAITVAVVSYNTRDLLDRCLDSLRAPATSGSCDVWVVDNGSADGSPEMVAERHPWAKLHADGANRGFGAAVNLVARHTNSEWLASANADIEVRAGALEKLLAAGASHARVGVLAPRLRLPDGSTQHSVHGFPTVPYTLGLNLGLDRVVPRLGDHLCYVGSWDSERPRRVDWAVGAFLMVRRCAFEEVGGFDEQQWMYAEDLDLGWRLARAGWSTWYEPAAVMLHHESAATQQVWGDEKQLRWMLSTYAWSLRRRGVAVTRVTAAINFLGALARAAPLTVGAWLAPGRFRAPRDVALRWARLHRRTGLSSRVELERHR